MIGKKVLIVSGKHSGSVGTIGFVYWKSSEGFCQAEERSNSEKRFLVIPAFDHCGSPVVIDLSETEIRYITNYGDDNQ